MELTYLFAGFAVFWAGLLAYLVMLQQRLGALRGEVNRLEERLAEASPGASRTATQTTSRSPVPEAMRSGV